ncbi:MAG: hypothetical protein ABEK36_04645, partial [Candidatus Aenigmatarchaeota archaeon]
TRLKSCPFKTSKRSQLSLEKDIKGNRYKYNMCQKGDNLIISVGGYDKDIVDEEIEKVCGDLRNEFKDRDPNISFPNIEEVLHGFDPDYLERELVGDDFLVPLSYSENAREYKKSFFENGQSSPESKGLGIYTRFASTPIFVCNNNERFRNKLKEELQGETVIDLGAGKLRDGFYLASKSGAKSYIGIDLYHADELAEDMFSLVDDSVPQDYHLPCKNKINSIIVEDDIEDFLEKVPDGIENLNFLSFGINDDVIIDEKKYERIRSRMNEIMSPGSSIVKRNGICPPNSKKVINCCEVTILSKNR